VPRISTQPLADQPLGALPSTSDRGPQPLHWPPVGAGRQVPTFHTGARTKLAPPPCRTPPGQSAGTRQAQSRAGQAARFRCRLSQFSTRHQWIAHARLLGPHLTRSRRALLPGRSPPRLLTAAARGGLRPPPAGRPRRTTDLSARPSISDAAPHQSLRSSTSTSSAFVAHPAQPAFSQKAPVPDHPTVRTGPDRAPRARIFMPRGASAPPGPSSPGALHRHCVGALTRRAAFPVAASALATACLRNSAVSLRECSSREWSRALTPRALLLRAIRSSRTPAFATLSGFSDSGIGNRPRFLSGGPPPHRHCRLRKRFARARPRSRCRPSSSASVAVSTNTGMPQRMERSSRGAPRPAARARRKQRRGGPWVYRRRSVQSH
jgi:hypothetical protein